MADEGGGLVEVTLCRRALPLGPPGWASLCVCVCVCVCVCERESESESESERERERERERRGWG